MLTLGLLTGCVVLVPSDWDDSSSGQDSGDPTSKPAALVTIQDLQLGSIPEGTRVSVTGIASHEGHPDGVFLQDGSPEEWSGLWVEGQNIAMPDHARGDKLQVIGTYTELSGFTAVVLHDTADVTWLDSGQSLRGPTTLTSELFKEAEDLEPYEAMLVEVQDALVIEGDSGSQGFEIELAGGGQLLVSDQLYAFQDLSGNTLERLTGLLAWRDHRWHLVPRSAEDATFEKCDTASEPEPLTVWELSTGDLIITEVMVDPQDCPITNCDWIEVLNTLDAEIDLYELTIYDDLGNKSSVAEELRVSPREYVLLAMGDQADWTYSEVTPHAWLADGMTLSSVDTRLSLGPTTQSNALDQIIYSASDVVPGSAHQLSPQSLSREQNDQDINWCPATQAIPGSVDRGTPAGENRDC